MGLPQIGYQTFKLMAYQRLHEMARSWEARYPGVDIVLIEPEPNDELMFQTSIMNYTKRVQIAKHGFQSVTLKLASDYESFREVCERHGIEISATRVRKVVKHFSVEHEKTRARWAELTDAESFDFGERWRVDARIRRLNELGFDVGELAITTDFTGTSLHIQPKVVDAGHHTRRLIRLTGLDVEENQARRLLNDMHGFAAAHELQNEDPMIVAHRWLTEVYEPLLALVPREKLDTLEPAEVFHDVLVHKWLLSERAGEEVDFFDVARSYVADVLPDRAAKISQAFTRVDDDAIVY